MTMAADYFQKAIEETTKAPQEGELISIDDTPVSVYKSFRQLMGYIKRKFSVQYACRKFGVPEEVFYAWLNRYEYCRIEAMKCGIMPDEIPNKAIAKAQEEVAHIATVTILSEETKDVTPKTTCETVLEGYTQESSLIEEQKSKVIGKICDALRLGSPLDYAVSAGGITMPELKAMMKDDPKIQSRLLEAEGLYAKYFFAKMTKCLDVAANKGNLMAFVRAAERRFSEQWANLPQMIAKQISRKIEIPEEPVEVKPSTLDEKEMYKRLHNLEEIYAQITDSQDSNSEESEGEREET